MNNVYTNPDILNQPTKLVYSKFEILNKDFFVTERIEGSVQTGNITVDSNSDIRRTANITLLVKDSTFEPNEVSKLWMAKYMRIYIGLYNFTTEEIVYWNMGLYNFTVLNYTYDKLTNTVNVNCVDLMSELNGTRNGYLDAQGVQINATKGTKISKVITDILDNNTNFKKYIVEEIGSEYKTTTSPYTGEAYSDLPYDIELSGDTTIYQIFNKLCNLYPNWEMFFDVDGVFHIQHIPTKDSDPIFITNDIIDPLVISENSSIDYSKIANTISVWGKLLESDRYSETSSYSNGVYSITLGSFSSDSIPENINIGFKTSSASSGDIFLKINSFSELPIKTEDNITPVLEKDKLYIVKYNSISSQFDFLGEAQVYGRYTVTDINNPFCVQNIGEVVRSFSGGEYDNIYSSELAEQRAKWEAYKATILQKTLTLNSILIPWLDVNKKVEYTSKRTKEKNIYMVQTINFDIVAWTMSVTLNEFYSYYNFE